MSEPTLIDPAEIDLEHWDDAMHGRVSWRTLFSSDRTNTEDLVCGIAEFPAGSVLKEHRHVQAEVVHVLSGGGMATVAGVRHALRPPATVYVPGNVPHAFVAGPEGLKLFYVFATSSFADIRYEFTPT